MIQRNPFVLFENIFQIMAKCNINRYYLLFQSMVMNILFLTRKTFFFFFFTYIVLVFLNIYEKIVFYTTHVT